MVVAEDVLMGSREQGDRVSGVDLRLADPAVSEVGSMGEGEGGTAALDAAMDRYADGDETAFERVYDELCPKLYAYLLRQTRNPARAEDLVQQTLMQIHCARGRFVRGASVRPWAFAIARRLLIDSIRRRRPEVGLDDADEGSLEASAGPRVGADDALHAHRMAHSLQLELAKLPETQRVAFELVKQDGLSLREAAEVLGTTVTAIKLRAHRAYAALRLALGEKEASR